MQLTYVFSELGQGLRRNLSMHIAVVLTIFVSLTLVGLGLLLRAEADKTEERYGDLNQITVFLCNDNSKSPNCTGDVTPAQKNAILKVIEDNPEVDDYHTESKEVAYEKTKELFSDEYVSKLPESFGPDSLRESVWIDLKDRDEYEGITSAVSGLDGVDNVRDSRNLVEPIFRVLDALQIGGFIVAVFLGVAALLLVANTIRLAAFARRREIGIMRLVGASTLYVALPFLLEAVVTAVLGLFLTAVALAALVEFVIINGFSVRDHLQFMPWIDWSDYVWALGWIALLGPAFTVIPTLVLAQKYLKV